MFFLSSRKTFILFAISENFKAIIIMPEFNFNKEVIKTRAKLAAKRVSFRTSFKFEERQNEIKTIVVPTLNAARLVFADKRDVITKVSEEKYFIDNKYTYTNYIMITNNLSNAVKTFNNSDIKILFAIIDSIKYNSNILHITYSDLKDITNINSNDTIFNSICNLVDNNIIYRTDIQSTYVINHTMMFKGDYDAFVRIYNDMYSDVSPDDYYDSETKTLYIKEFIKKTSKFSFIKDAPDNIIDKVD